MALFNEIQVGRYNRFVQKLLSMKGPPTMPTVSSDLMFVHPMSSGVENRYLEGWDLFAFAKTVTGSVGNAQQLELRNPDTSNTIAVITRAMFVATTGTTNQPRLIIVRRGATTLLDQLTIDVAGSFDRRIGRPASTCIISDNNGAAITATGGTGTVVSLQSFAAANNNIEFLRAGDEIPLLPGDAIYITEPTTAQSDVIGFWWRERALEDSERS